MLLLQSADFFNIDLKKNSGTLLRVSNGLDPD